MTQTLVISTVDTFKRQVAFAIPPEDPKVEGYLTIEFRALSKRQVQELLDRELDDVEMFGELVHAVHGLGGPNGETLTGQAALDEVTQGQLSMWLVPGIVQDYFEQYGQARRGNSKRRR